VGAGYGVNPFGWLLGGIVGAIDYALGFLVDVFAAVLLAVIAALVEVAKFLLRGLPDMPDAGSSASLVLDYGGAYIPVAAIVTAFALWFTFYQLLSTAQVVKFIRGA
jgi:hypothetical protein